jgi:hypothetical protein
LFLLSHSLFFSFSDPLFYLSIHSLLLLLAITTLLLYPFYSSVNLITTEPWYSRY